MAVPTLAPSPSAGVPVVPARRTALFALPEMRWAALALGLFLLGLVAQLAGTPHWLWWALYLACYAAGGWEPGLAGLQALREKTLDVDLLMVVAAIGAAAIGQITDGALLIVIFATSGALEALATARTEDSVRGLLDLAPDTAIRISADGSEETVRAADLEIGDVLMVRPGERIAADATVIDGGSEVDQATITGEPLPVDKTAGDEVFAGTLNGTGALRLRVDRRSEDSVVARIAALVEQASRTKARTQLFIEKVEQRYSLGMVAATLAVFLIPLLLGDPLQRALLRAMTFMIVASPCAVVLATMPPLLAAIANAGRHGVLVKSAVVMEQLGTTTRIAFDKTGTLTRGIPELAEVRCLATDFTERDVLRLAAAVEHASEHPLAAAIVRAARSAGLALPTATEFTADPGRGVAARIDGRTVQVGSPTALLSATHHDAAAANSRGLADAAAAVSSPEDPASTADDGAVAQAAGDPRPIADIAAAVRLPEGSASAATEDMSMRLAAGAYPAADERAAVQVVVDELQRGGFTVVVVVVEGRPIGVVAISDQVRPEAAAAVGLAAQIAGAAPVLVTGDNEHAAARLAAQVGITEVHAGLLPEGKVGVVRGLQAGGQPVGPAGARSGVSLEGEAGVVRGRPVGGQRVVFVRDGINDAPALAAADSGIAMGGAGSDLTLQTADAVVVRDDLTAVPTVIALSRRARRVVVANLAIAATFIAVLVVWDLVGTLPLPLGVAGHEGSTVIVGLNGLRLLRRAVWRQAGRL
ncbi:heavy metal translocating P-type ATPase [Nocardia sp. NPDC088792]|uniref:heavy metal translocating P-type ATPase n=1 Tax=Nocardia sp. NPDC088792 TaxID=3364332 RepID=UPI0037FE98BF